MFRANNKGTKTTPCFNVSIVNFEQVNAFSEIFDNVRNTSLVIQVFLSLILHVIYTCD